MKISKSKLIGITTLLGVAVFFVWKLIRNSSTLFKGDTSQSLDDYMPQGTYDEPEISLDGNQLIIDPSLPRGIRNNNPLNIRYNSNNPWQGRVPHEFNNDFAEYPTNIVKAFEQFYDIKFGIRAAFKTLKSYRDNHGLNTIRGIIERWAPPSDDNPTESYIQNVVLDTGLLEDQPLEWINTESGYDHYLALVKSMAHKENGVPLSNGVVEDVMQEFYQDLT